MSSDSFKLAQGQQPVSYPPNSQIDPDLERSVRDNLKDAKIVYPNARWSDKDFLKYLKKNDQVVWTAIRNAAFYSTTVPARIRYEILGVLGVDGYSFAHLVKGVATGQIVELAPSAAPTSQQEMLALLDQAAHRKPEGVAFAGETVLAAPDQTPQQQATEAVKNSAIRAA